MKNTKCSFSQSRAQTVQSASKRYRQTAHIYSLLWMQRLDKEKFQKDLGNDNLGKTLSDSFGSLPALVFSLYN